MEEIKQYSQENFYLDIISILDEKVQKIARKEWEDDKCPPEFWVSIDNEDMDNQSILISVRHLGLTFTEKLFPRKNTQWGYDSVLDQMISLYNRTM